MSRYLKHLPPLDTLITFEAVGRNGSFTRAASELCLTQSAVSNQLRALEDHLKLALFERQPRGVSLTRAGASLFGEVSTLLERLQQLHMCRHIDIFQGVQLHHRFKPGNIIGPLFARKDIGAYLNRCG